MSSSDETTTHEQLTETRSWSEYDEDGNVTADHTTVRAICGTCYREQIDRHGHLEYVSADWPCDGAENARLRERVAALEAIADGAFDDVVRVVAGTAEYESAEWRVRLTLLLPKLSAALAQADETGGAR